LPSAIGRSAARRVAERPNQRAIRPGIEAGVPGGRRGLPSSAASGSSDITIRATRNFSERFGMQIPEKQFLRAPAAACGRTTMIEARVPVFVQPSSCRRELPTTVM
jgi:hypothetical protein